MPLTSMPGIVRGADEDFDEWRCPAALAVEAPTKFDYRGTGLSREVRFYSLAGNTLTIKTAPAKSAIDGREGVTLLVWEKIEGGK